MVVRASREGPLGGHHEVALDVRDDSYRVSQENTQSKTLLKQKLSRCRNQIYILYELNNLFFV